MSKSEIIASNPLAFAGTPRGHVFLSLHTVMYRNKNGDERPYFMCARGDQPSSITSIKAGMDKRPEAVVVLGIKNDGNEPQLVMTKEFRVPIGCVELGFPAGLIDPSDYAPPNSASPMKTDREAAANAAIREFKEETGLTFNPKECSPSNLYSSAGMTDESVCVVIGTCNGTVSQQHLEANEDIEVVLLTHNELTELLTDDDNTAYGKVAWPFLWAFKNFGFPTFSSE